MSGSLREFLEIPYDELEEMNLEGEGRARLRRQIPARSVRSG